MMTREMEQVDQMRGHLTALVKTLEDDVTSHHVRPSARFIHSLLVHDSLTLLSLSSAH